MPGFWRKCRIAFRCVRITVWVLVLAVIGLFLWCNRVGLPDFLKTRLVANLHERGLNLEFSRVRLSLVHGIIAENVHLEQTQTNSPANIAARRVQMEFDWPALFRHQRLDLDGLVLHDTKFALELSPTKALTLTNLQADLRFGINDTWSLNHLRADFAGTQISINGEVMHAPEVLSWKMFAGHQADRGAFVNSLNHFANTLQEIHFAGHPELQLRVSGDARNVHSMLIRLRAMADGVRTPWFNAREFEADAQLTVPASAPTNLMPGWGFWTNLQPFRLACSVKLDALHAKQLSGKTIDFAGVWAAPTLQLHHFSARLGDGQLTAAGSLNVSNRILTFTCDSAFDPHTIAPLLTDKARERLADVSWTSPPKVHATGSLQLPAWTNSTQETWRRDIEPSVSVGGELAFTNAIISDIQLDRVHTHFHYANQLWELTDLSLAQGQTHLTLSGQESETTKNFHARLKGQVDVHSVHPFLKTPKAVHAFKLLTFNDPLQLTLETSGNLRTLTTLTATGHVALSNLAIRGQTLDSVAAGVFYTNRELRFDAPEILRAGGTQRMTADSVLLDFKTLTGWINNGWSTADPLPVTKAIGPKTGHAMEPFKFATPPLVRVNGSVPLFDVNAEHKPDNADLTIEVVRGSPFRWGRLNATNLTGTVHWLKQSLLLTNLQAELYEGKGHGSVELDFRPREHDFDYDFFWAVTNVNVHLLARDISSETNLEGLLDGQVTVTNASSDDWHSVNGHGHAHLRNGLLWDVPMFAFMSPVLNAVSPGLGNSRAKDATAKFVISNGVVKTDSLLISSTMMRLQYSGTVDLKQNVNAKVTAQLLRNTPVVGSLMSAVLWPVSKIFECHVTGQLEHPDVKPIYIPKILLVPLHPIRSLEQLFSPSSGSDNSDANDAD